MTQLATIKILPSVPLNGLVGSATLEFRHDGVRILARRAARVVPWTAGILVGLAGITAAAIALLSLDMVSWLNGKGAFLVGMVFGIVPGWFVHDQLARRLRGTPVDVMVLWPGLAVTQASPQRYELNVRAEGFTGVLAFEPASPESAAVLGGALTRGP